MGFKLIQSCPQICDFNEHTRWFVSWYRYLQKVYISPWKQALLKVMIREWKHPLALQERILFPKCDSNLSCQNLVLGGVAFIEHLLCGRHCTKCFDSIGSFSTQDTSHIATHLFLSVSCGSQAFMSLAFSVVLLTQFAYLLREALLAFWLPSHQMFPISA